MQYQLFGFVIYETGTDEYQLFGAVLNETQSGGGGATTSHVFPRQRPRQRQNTLLRM